MRIRALTGGLHFCSSLLVILEGLPNDLKVSRDLIVAQFLSRSTEGPILEQSKYHMLSPRD